MTGGWLSHERQYEGSKLWPGFGQAGPGNQNLLQLRWYDQTSPMTQPVVGPVSPHSPRCCPAPCRCCRLASYICSQNESSVTPTQQQGLIYNLGMWMKKGFVFFWRFFLLFPFMFLLKWSNSQEVTGFSQTWGKEVAWINHRPPTATIFSTALVWVPWKIHIWVCQPCWKDTPVPQSLHLDLCTHSRWITASEGSQKHHLHLEIYPAPYWEPEENASSFDIWTSHRYFLWCMRGMHEKNQCGQTSIFRSDVPRWGNPKNDSLLLEQGVEYKSMHANPLATAISDCVTAIAASNNKICFIESGGGGLVVDLIRFKFD